MKKILVTVLFFSALNLNANLVEEVDKLTPEEAYLVMTKLQAKIHEPVPQSFFTKFTVSMSAGTAFAYPKHYNQTLAYAHRPFDSFYYGSANLLWKLTPKYLLGFIFGGIGNVSFKEISPNVFQAISIGGANMMIGTGYIFDINEKNVLLPLLGAGLFIGGAGSRTTNDTTQVTYDYGYYGAGFAGQAGLTYLHRFNRVWSIGAEATYFYARINGAKRFEKTIANPQDLTFNGGRLGFVFAYNI